MATSGDISDLDKLYFAGSWIYPEQSNYSEVKQSGIIKSDMVGGAMRQRKKYHNNTTLIDVSYLIKSKSMLDWFKIFRDRNEGKFFVCYQKIDRPIMEQYVAQFIDDITIVELSENIYRVSSTMEVISARDANLDAFLYEIYQVVPELGNWTDAWHRLATALPEA